MKLNKGGEMMKKPPILILVIIAVVMIVALISIENAKKVGNCEHPNCPKETYYGHTYCRTHKCANLTCDNKKPYGDSYCEECRNKN